MRARIVMACVAAALVLGAVLAVHATGALEGAERSTVDLRFEIRGTTGAPSSVVIVGIDDQTLAKINRYPLSRFLYARALPRIAAARPAAIVFDVQFTEKSDNANADDALIRAAHRAPGTIFTTVQSDAHGRTKVFGGGSGLAFSRGVPASPRVECDAICRRVPYAVGSVKTVAVRVAERVAGHSLSRAAFGSVPFWIDYRGPTATVPELPFVDVETGHFDPSRLRGRVVIVGAYAPSLGDLHSTPFSNSPPMSGTELQANAIATALAGAPLRPASAWLAWLAIVLFAVAGPLAAMRSSRLRLTAAVTVPLAAGYLIVAQLTFDSGRIVAVVDPLLALLLGAAAALTVVYFSATFEREWTRRRLVRTQRRVVEVADEERRRLERNIHDGAQQGLIAVGMWIAQLRGRLGDRVDPEIEALLERVNHGVAEALGDLRSLGHGAYPAILSDRGLDAALRSLLERTPAVVGLEGSVGRRLAPEVEATAYFVACEALANVAKHADATRSSVRVQLTGERLELTVVDDGVGGARLTGSGIGGLRERVELLGGSLSVTSPPGVGTRVVLSLPVARGPEVGEHGAHPSGAATVRT